MNLNQSLRINSPLNVVDDFDKLPTAPLSTTFEEVFPGYEWLPTRVGGDKLIRDNSFDCKLLLKLSVPLLLTLPADVEVDCR